MHSADEAQDNYQKAQDPNTASLGHEVVAGGAAFFAMHEFEKHQRAEGKTALHILHLPFDMPPHSASPLYLIATFQY